MTNSTNEKNSVQEQKFDSVILCRMEILLPVSLSKSALNYMTTADIQHKSTIRTVGFEKNNAQSLDLFNYVKYVVDLTE
jgi:hypothetical protein